MSSRPFIRDQLQGITGKIIDRSEVAVGKKMHTLSLSWCRRAGGQPLGHLSEPNHPMSLLQIEVLAARSWSCDDTLIRTGVTEMKENLAAYEKQGMR